MNRMKDGGAYLRLASNRGKSKNASCGGGDFYEESHFNELLNLEKKRSRRSMRPLMLMQLDISGLAPSHKAEARRKLEQALASGIRETDVCGWYKQAVVGILFTELTSSAPRVRDVLIRRVMARLVRQIDPEALFKIKVSFRAFPEDEAPDHSCAHNEPDWRKDLAKTAVRRDLSSRVKILKDVVGHFLMT
jgi:hypothetical protein